MPVLIKANESTAERRRVYFHLVEEDGITPATGEDTEQPQISVNGGAWTDTGIGTLTHIGNGRYYADLTQTVVGTAGDSIETRYKSTSTAECPGDSVRVVAFDPYSSTNLGLSALPTANPGSSGGLLRLGTSGNSARLYLNEGIRITNSGFLNPVEVVCNTDNQIGGVVIGASNEPSNVLALVTLGAQIHLGTSTAPTLRDAILTAGAINSTVAPNLDAAVSSRLAPTVSGRTLDVTTGGAAGIDWANVEGQSTTVTLSGTTVGTTTAVATGGITAASFAAGAIDAAALATDAANEIRDAVWAAGTRTLTSGANIVLAKGTGVTGFNDLDAAGVRSAVGLAAANLDTQLGAIDDYVDTEVSAIKSVTDKLDTMLSIVGSGPNYQYTSEALENAPAGGGGGTTDWTATERQQIRYRLGIDGSESAPASNTPELGVVQADVALWRGDQPVTLTSGRVEALVGAYASGQAPLQPTVAGRTLDVTATGCAGIDWSNVEGQSSVVNLPTTVIGTVTTVSSLDNGAISQDTIEPGALTAEKFAANSITASALAADAVDEILDEPVEGSITFRQMLRLFAAALAGKVSGAATTTVSIRDLADTKNRVVATVTADGDRTAVTLDLT